MKHKIKTIVAGLFMFCGLASFLATTPASVGAQADIKSNVCGGVGIQVSSATCSSGAAETTALDRLIANIVNILSIIVGIVAVVMIIIGGFKYITSGGDSGNISSAKTTIVYALVGLVIVALAQVIVRFVLAKAG